jgi:hypothetical protein
VNQSSRAPKARGDHQDWRLLRPYGPRNDGKGLAPRNDGPLCHRERQRRVAITRTGDCFGPAGLAMTGRGSLLAMTALSVIASPAPRGVQGVAITRTGDCFGPAGLAMTGRGCAPCNDGPLCHRERQRRVAITWTGDCFGPTGLAMTGRGCAPRNDGPSLSSRALHHVGCRAWRSPWKGIVEVSPCAVWPGPSLISLGFRSSP